MKYPLHVIVRKKLSSLINGVLSFFTRKSAHQKYIDVNEIKNILIIRPNYRIGNLIFLTPLINELQKNIPNAKIDIIVGMKLAGKILEPMPNVDKVIDIPRKLLLHPLEMFAYIHKTRAKKYDVALNISGGSTSAQIVTALVKAKYKASFSSDKLWADFTHIQERGRPTHIHMGLEPLEFLRFFNIEVPQQKPNLDIKLTQDEINEAKNDLQTLLHVNNISADKKVIAIFRNARFDKKISDVWWSQWIDELLKINPNTIIVDILSPDIPQKLNEKVLEYSNKNLRVLGAFFKTCDLYVSADTGPMHLAAASGAKVLALFNKTNMEVYGALGEQNKTVDMETLLPQDVAKITINCITSQS
ncbi:glycosyltransferase family 9 protein [Sulfurimonas autotrophica]|uniref:Glycosyl transferase family 9 n=1 Tax=Sulfurimonas autotrophica (strain ATCC BAA-671 / DSM 16294 / JCM 11897 / OK10) TaxID=563040 RepID=E0UV17_SULAO|nr:glycosyltransferase family 9 protein [Sulfurimonas autotrophica]ADN09599.1 glycosyl transferase family 9 [Sulfurimonas autotrophica DSM 16294]